ncbi:MAG: oligosaccharide flippase family protein [Lachnospiraceae bacterium]|nr:oligosaccharide flippase family protein [Lachnospiraceae bacterium]
MNQKRYLIKGTLLLTVMGLLTRVAGFFYKIFLSRTIGAAEIGLYQMTIPVFSFCTALCGGGIQTAVSRFVAEALAAENAVARENARKQDDIPHRENTQAAKDEPSRKKPQPAEAESDRKNARIKARRALLTGLLLSLPASVFCMILLYFGADLIGRRFLLEESCAGLLKVMAFSLPFSTVHCCVCGYFMGSKKVLPPAFSQFIEQMVRIFFVVSAYCLSLPNGTTAGGARLMVLGQLLGEAACAIFVLACMGCLSRTSTAKHPLRAQSHSAKHPMPTQSNIPLRSSLKQSDATLRSSLRQSGTIMRSIPVNPGAAFRRCRSSAQKMLSVSLPLGLNRMLMCVLQAIEASLLPQMLQRAGQSSMEAISDYGTLTGMAMPMILFPTAVTSALGMLLLPTVSEAHALQQKKQLTQTVNATFMGGLILGSFCLGLFLLFGDGVGNILFQNSLAGVYIRRLALICPLIYINTTMMSILHGLDRSASILLWNLAGFALRFFCILRLVPLLGMNGYLWGLLLDDLLVSVCILFTLRRASWLTVSVPDLLAKMLLPAITGGGAVLLFRAAIAQKISPMAAFAVSGGIYCLTFAGMGRVLLWSDPKKMSDQKKTTLFSGLSSGAGKKLQKRQRNL